MVAVKMGEDYSGDQLRELAGNARDGNQVRRLIALAAVRDGMSREQAANVGLMDRQTLRDWVIRFNNQGPDGLIDRKSTGPKPKLNDEQIRELCQLVEDGPQSHVAGLIRWRCCDLVDVVKQRFKVDCHKSTIGRLLKRSGYSHISPRPQHPKQSTQAIEEFKKTSAMS